MDSGMVRCSWKTLGWAGHPSTRCTNHSSDPESDGWHVEKFSVSCPEHFPVSHLGRAG